MKGSCLCGAVAFEVDKIPESYRACHCTACRKSCGHYWSAFSVDNADFRFTEDRGLKGYRSSNWAERGFCKECGASLFFKPLGKGIIEVAPGSIDGPTGTMLAGHIFVGFKGDYYELADGLPQRQD
jgi:hypothetical protein